MPILGYNSHSVSRSAYLGLLGYRVMRIVRSVSCSSTGSYRSFGRAVDKESAGGNGLDRKLRLSPHHHL